MAASSKRAMATSENCWSEDRGNEGLDLDLEE